MISEDAMFWLLMLLTMLLTMPADAGKKNKKEPVPPTDHGEVAFNGLSMRAETYKGGTVKTEGVFGGVCTVPTTNKDWLVFPILPPGQGTFGACTQMSPILGAMKRADSAPLDTINLGDPIVVSGLLTQNITFVGMNTQYSLEIAEVTKKEGVEPAPPPANPLAPGQ